MELDTPTFAVVGAVNHGKSSVVSTLSENDQVRISSMPGETVECQRFWLLDLFVFYDTPGFQNAIEALAELRPAAQARDPLSIFRAFIALHRGHPEFEAECLLFEPIVDGAGIVYVVDGSEPVLEIHAAEMEILRLTGQPRLAIINRTSADDHIGEWKRRLGLHFNAVREFNAHDATFADRVELLETLAGIEQEWKPKLSRAVAIFREEWDKRLEDCAEILIDLLVSCLTHRETAAGSDLKSRREAIAEKLKERFMAAVSSREARAHQDIIRLFGHSRVKAEAASEQLFEADLFSDDTWRAFGLDEKQLIAAGAIGGGAAGMAVDIATAGHSIGLPTALGAGAGALSAYLVGRRRPELKVELPAIGQEIRLGGSAISVGPYRAVNFPWILLDRAIGVYCHVVNRAHARRDEAILRGADLRRSLERLGVTSARWSASKRMTCEKAFAAIRRGRFDAPAHDMLRNVFLDRLREVGALRISEADDPRGPPSEWTTQP